MVADLWKMIMKILSKSNALAGLAFGVTVVTAIQQMGQKDPKSVSLVTAKSGFFSMGAVALIYLLLILLGAMSLGQFKLSPEGEATVAVRGVPKSGPIVAWIKTINVKANPVPSGNPRWYHALKASLD